MTSFWLPDASLTEPLYRQGDLLRPVQSPDITQPAAGALALPPEMPAASFLSYWSEPAPLLVLSQCCTIGGQMRGGVLLSLIVCPTRCESVNSPEDLLWAQSPAGAGQGHHIGRFALETVLDVLQKRGQPGKRPNGVSVQRLTFVDFNDCYSIRVRHAEEATRPVVAARMSRSTRSILRIKLGEFFDRPAPEDS